MTKLYELTGEFRRLMDAVVDQETGEYDEERVPGFAEVLKELTGNIEAKLEGCAKATKMMAPRFIDHEPARKEGLPGAIVPGIMSQAVLAAVIHRWSPGCTIVRIDTRTGEYVERVSKS